VWHDRDENGLWDDGEPGLNGWTVYLDLNDSGRWDAAEPAFSTTHDGLHDGAFWFHKDGIAPGTYWLREILPPDITTPFPAGTGLGHLVTVAAGAPAIAGFGETSAPNFGNTKSSSSVHGAIQGFKWHDLDQDGRWREPDQHGRSDATESGRAGFLVFLDLDCDGNFDASSSQPPADAACPVNPLNAGQPEPFAITGADGRFVFANVPPGTYRIREDTSFFSDGTFVVQPYPQLPFSSHVVTVQAGQLLAGSFGKAEVPNFGALEYSPFVRPADDHFGHLDRPYGADLLTTLRPWQSFRITNSTGTQFRITGIDLLDRSEQLVPQPFRQFVTITAPSGQPIQFPITVSNLETVELLAFYDPAIRSSEHVLQHPAWLGPPTPPHTFQDGDHLRIATDADVAYRVDLVGAATFDSDISFDGSVDDLDLQRLDGFLKVQSSIVEGSATSPSRYVRFDPTSDVNANCPNGAERFVGMCSWPLSGSPRREISLGDLGPINVEFQRARAPFLDLDLNDDSGALGVGFQTVYAGSSTNIADRDAQFANHGGLFLDSLVVTITNPLDGEIEQLDADLSGTTIALKSNLFLEPTPDDPDGSRVFILEGVAGVSEYARVLRTLTYSNSARANQTPRVITVSAQGSGESFVYCSTGVSAQHCLDQSGVVDQRAGNIAAAVILFHAVPAPSPVAASEGESQILPPADSGESKRPAGVQLNPCGSEGPWVCESEGPSSIDSTSQAALPEPLWRNPSNPYDVNGVDGVTPLDVLAIINYLNRFPDAAYLPSTQASLAFLDVNGDSWCTAQDVLMVINFLGSAAERGAEGEASTAHAASPPPGSPLSRFPSQDQAQTAAPVGPEERMVGLSGGNLITADRREQLAEEVFGSQFDARETRFEELFSALLGQDLDASSQVASH
jgi:hypothetical protein